MKINADTNVLLRAVTEDNREQAALAVETLASAQAVVVTLPTLCELVWVLSSLYRYSRAEIAQVVSKLADGRTVIVDHQAVAAGVAMLEAGGDFADAVIAHEGRWLGAETFVSFDRRAVKLLTEAGEKARLLEA